MKKLIVANWKMNPLTKGEVLKLAKASDKEGVVICPPFVFLEAVGKNLKKAALGAQDVPASPLMLKNLGVKYVILGHSERRVLGETDLTINKKVSSTLKVGLKVILCVGENLAVRKKGIAAAKKFIAGQIKKDLKFPTTYNSQAKNLIIAYEPVWSISTNKNAKSDSPKDAAEMIRFIKAFLQATSYRLKPNVLYGGSVSSKNIGGFLKYKDIGGFLVGGVSLRSREFSKIISKVE